MFKYLLLIFLGWASLSAYSQEIAPERLTTYTFHLNKLKTQEQVSNIEEKTKSIAHVSSCKLDWLNYQMVVVANEGGENGSFPVEQLKTILIEHHAALKTFTKETNPHDK